MANPRIGVVGLPGKWSTETLADAVEAEAGLRREGALQDRARGNVQLTGHLGRDDPGKGRLSETGRS